ncbi:MAG TPA: prolyl oligopeptidase family serine peptidase [Bacteroidales bacterium]|nr:prolyl oligopeptidase family serine peptidase [Bacteroidales bacterium]
MKSKIFILLSLFLSSALMADNSMYEKCEFVFKGDTLRYRVLFPENYDKSRKYPLVLFLHGSGERGSDNEAQLTHGASLFTDEETRKDYPSIVIFPQCPKSEFWAKMEISEKGIEFPEKPKITKSLLLVKKLLDNYKKKEAVDKKRIYVMGLSMGGMATFDLISRYPKYFAAAIPICGGINTDRLKKLRKMPIRIFHGGADPIVSREFSRNAYIELKARGSQRVEYVEFPDVGHNSWTPAFNYPDFLSWMYYQSH